MKVKETERQGVSGLTAVEQKFTDDLRWIFRRQPERDYGIDAIAEVVENGTTQGQLLALQIKSGSSYFERAYEDYIVFDQIKDKHRQYWIDCSLPVIIALHQPETNTVYWQVISNETVISTGKDWKIEVPRKQTICAEQASKLKSCCEFPLSPNSFTILTQNDISHHFAKRYSADILLNKTMSKGEIGQLIHHLTREMSHSNYYRSDLVKEHWQEEKAHVVCLNVYLSLEDQQDANCICQSQWIDPNLEKQSRPSQMTGKDIGDHIIVNWKKNEDYEFISSFTKDYLLNKEEYLKQVQPIWSSIKDTANKIIKITNQYSENELSEDNYLKEMKQHEKKVSELYFASTDIGLAPVECKDFNLKFQELMSHVHNISLFFTNDSLNPRTKENRDQCVKRYIREYLKTLPELNYEYKKLH